MKKKRARKKSISPPRRGKPPNGATLGISTPPNLPLIVISDRQLRDISDDALKAVLKANDPAFVFERGQELVRLMEDASGAIITPLGIPEARGILTRSANFAKKVRGQARHAHPPQDVVADFLSRGNWGFPYLKGLVRSPILHPDGTIWAKAGYDRLSNLLYSPQPGFKLPPVTLKPSSKQLAAAVALIDESICDFPFADAASRANSIALVLTASIRSFIAGVCPMALINAPQAGTGKGLFTHLVSVIALGTLAESMPACDSEAEWGKGLTSLLLEGKPIIAIDNIDGELRSAKLEAALTSEIWRHRLLGLNKTASLPNHSTWIANGNSVRLGGDLPRRVYVINLDATTDCPQEREQFRHPRLIDWARENRGRLVGAMFTLVRAWFAAGKPKPTCKTLGTFEEWVTVIGGILETAGIEGFLENRQQSFEKAAHETQPILDTLLELERRSGPGPFMVADIVRWRPEQSDGSGDDWDMSGYTDPAHSLEDILPGKSIEEGRKRGWSHVLGNLLASWEGRRMTKDGLRVERAGKRGHVVLWRIVRGA